MLDNLKEPLMLFYYHDGLKQCGPFTKKELGEKGINKDTLVWQEGDAYWQKAELINELQELFEKNSAFTSGNKITGNATPPPFSPKYIKEVRIAVLPKRSKILMLVSAALGLLLIAGVFAAKLRKDEANKKALDAIQISEHRKVTENEVSEKEAQMAVEKMLKEFEIIGRAKELERKGKKKKVEKSEKENKKEPEDRQNEFEDKKKIIRNNFKEWITAKENNYTRKEIGGIYDLSITITNTSPFLIDKAVVSISYIKANGNIYKVEELHFENIKPGAAVSQKAPNSERGKSVSHSITSIRCEGLNLCYREGKGYRDKSDPYYCR